MNNTIESNSQFLQYSNPGITGYSQKGADGISGDDGYHIYYTPYVGNSQYCIDRIKNRQELSDNINYQCKTINYKDNDMILDINGDLWNIRIVYFMVEGHETEIDTVHITKQNNIFSYTSESDDEFIHDFDVECFTSYTSGVDTSTYKQYKEYIPLDANSDDYILLPYQYYRDRYYEYTYGNWYKFTLTFNKSGDYLKKYKFKYVVILPNGITLEKLSNSNIDYIYIDNRELYGIHNMSFNTDVSSGYIPFDIYDASIFNSINYISGYDSSEGSALTAELFKNKINNFSTFYVDIINTESGKIYRKYKTIS